MKQTSIYLWLICLVSAMGGLLFGYDWVVVGGAKIFYEPFFQIEADAAMRGWAMSSALVGCLVGALLSGSWSDRYGRRRMLIVSAWLFLISAIGTGIVVRNQGTTGGSDIVGMLLQKYCHIRFSNAILLVDGAVVCFGLVVIGFGIGNAEDVIRPSWHLSFYSLIAIFIISRVIAYVINGSKNDKLIFVISDSKMTGLHEYILKDLDRTATYIKSSGLYSGADKEMLLLVVSYKEVAGIKLKIKQVDPRAFVIVTDAYDTFGEGWKQLPSPNDITPE